MQSAFDKLAPYIKALTLDDPLTILAKEAGIGIDNKAVEETAWKTFDAINGLHSNNALSFHLENRYTDN